MAVEKEIWVFCTFIFVFGNREISSETKAS